MAVLLDGRNWHDRRTVGDRDGLPITVLQGILHWPVVERVWLPDWLRDRTSIVERLKEKALSAEPARFHVQHAVLEDEDPATSSSSAATISDTLGPGLSTQYAAHAQPPHAESAHQGIGPATGPVGGNPLANTGRPRFQPYEGCPRGDRDELDQLGHGRVTPSVQQAIHDVLSRESPVHRERLARLVSEDFGLTRLSEGRIDAVIAALPRHPDAGGFAWSDGQDMAEWPDFRPDPEAQRPIEHVSYQELANAMQHVARAAFEIREDELFKEVLETFGFKRRTSRVRDRLAAALEFGVGSGRLARDGSTITAG